ncbi:MAG: YigZ family protein [Saprospiraceae bacterium]|nr:YigZ family protein [Saprospiraceae bacterium]
MSEIYTYLTLAAPSEGRYTEKGSKFLTSVYPVSSPEDLAEALQTVRAAHPKARHVCYAWRLLEDGRLVEYSTDAGEPGGSAGLPILNALKSAELIQVVAIVVRYYGGTKLGIPGLIQAYRTSTEDAIAHARPVTRTRRVRYRLSMPLALQPHFLEACKRLEIPVSDLAYDARFHVNIDCAMPGHEALLLNLLRMVSQRDLGAREAYLAYLGMEVSL